MGQNYLENIKSRLFKVPMGFESVTKHSATNSPTMDDRPISTSEASPFFQFEQDFITGLRCIPMVVRYRLDRVGIKLKLHHWNQLSEADRLRLVVAPCDTLPEQETYRQELRELVAARSGEIPKDLPLENLFPWLSADLPDSVATQAERVGVTLNHQQWRSLSELQRFALIKLSQPGHENRNFLPAVQEFGLLNP